MKKCIRCEEVKVFTDFTKDKNKLDGLCQYCKVCKHKIWKTWRDKNIERENSRTRDERRELRKEVIRSYGGICACCGENKLEFLSIDHVNGGGTKERKLDTYTNTKIMRNIRRIGCSLEYRILCHNCNSSIGYYGYCPHNM